MSETKFWKVCYLFDLGLQTSVTMWFRFSSALGTPFNKELFVAGYVEDSMLDIIKDGKQVGGAFVVLVYHEIGKPFKYYLMVSRKIGHRLVQVSQSQPNL